MIHERIRLGGIAIGIMLLAASCSTHNCKLCAVAPAPSKPWSPPPDPEYFCGDELSEEYFEEMTDLTNASAREDGFDVLLLSGGGSRGSFGAGLLYGWDSPKFDMVTGISTGAIMATWAYLGRDHSTKPYETMKGSYDGVSTTRRSASVAGCFRLWTRFTRWSRFARP